MSYRNTDAVESSTARKLTVSTLRERAGKLLPAIAKGAAERERARKLPTRQIRQLAAARLFTFRIPGKYGGAASTVQEAIQFVVDLAAVDSNIAQALRPSFSFIEGLLAGDSEPDRKRWFARYLAGDIFGNAGWEIGGANGAISSRIAKQGNHYKVTGSKYYSTGALYADWVSATALNDEDKPVSFILPRGRKGLQLIDDFDAMGQRLTVSGTTKLEDVTVYSHELRQRGGGNGQRSSVTPFLQLYLAAVLAGIARNALTDAVSFTRKFARPIKHSTAKLSVEDPYVQFSVGEIAARAYTAEAVVLKAAAAIDAYLAAGRRNDLVVAASIEVAQAQFIAAESALKAAELIFDVGGASTTARVHNLDRHWRNARTAANHNPRHWKASVAGAYHLSGTEPPQSGLF